MGFIILDAVSVRPSVLSVCMSVPGILLDCQFYMALAKNVALNQSRILQFQPRVSPAVSVVFHCAQCKAHAGPGD